MALAVLLAMLPTLSWQEFSGGSENLVVAAALEMHRTGNWAIPTLQGQPRLAKPPLATWIAAKAMRPATLRAISDPDPAVRDSAYGRLAFEVRWPAAVMSCLMLVAVYELALLLGGVRFALLATLICGTNYAFLRFSRLATTDVPLALFVTLASLFLAHALFAGRRFSGLAGAGLTVGLAMLSKGPAGLAQTVLPVSAFVVLRWAVHREKRAGGGPTSLGASAWPGALTGLLLMAAVGLSWFLVVLVKYNAGKLWWSEVMEGSQDLATDPWYTYLKLIGPLMMPWIIFFFVGLGMAAMAGWRWMGRHWEKMEQRTAEAMLFVLLLLLVPIFVMSFFHDLKDRYLQPMLPAAAMLAAWGVLAWMDSAETWVKKVLGVGHYGIVIAAGVFFPLAAMLRLPQLTRADGQPWLPMWLGASAATAGLLIVLICIAMQRRRPMAMATATALVMLMVQVPFIYGYSRTADAMAETRPLAAEIWAQYPQAEMYTFWPYELARHAPEELSIYLNRSIRPVLDPARIPRSPNPQLLLVYYPKKQAPPVLPPQWTALESLRRDGNIGVMYCRPPE
jgi:4-amino-4-deoxy-L-arabinose transferase-like glycosyltransferase